MAQPPKTYVDVLRSPQTKADMQSFKSDLAALNKEVQALVSGFKDIDKVTKAIKAASIFNNPGGTDAYFGGKQYKENQAALDVARLGTATGQAADQQRRLNQEIEKGARDLRKTAESQRVISLNTTKEIRNVQTLNNLKDLQQLKEVAIKREAFARNNLTEYQVKIARDLQRTIDRRIASLKEENKLRQEAAKDPKVISQRSRELTQERLFGDSGAGLFKIQTGLLANYLLLNQVRTAAQSAATFTIQLDESLRNLQAIVRVTDTNMASLRDRLIEISEETKFTALEVTNAAVTLGQAGLSPKEIEDSVRAVGLLATATGTDLNRAVDIATSTLGVFNMESSHMATVANVMTEAVNSSKLNIEKLTLGLQYSGNIAAQSGVQFDELTSAFGAMANAGIRSGSTLGTGMRQVLIALQKPSKEFLSILGRLGLSMDDVDLRSKGLYGALKNLKDAGFTASDAIKAFEVRAAAAYNALSGNLDQMLDLRDSFLHTTAAAKANETQMQALANQGRRIGSILGSVAYEGLEPMAMALRDILKWLGDVLSAMREYPVVLKVVSTGLAALATSFALVRYGPLLANLVGLQGVLGGIAGGFTRVAASSAAGAAGLTFFGRALAFTGPVMGLALAISAVVGAFSLLRPNTRDSAVALEAAQTAFDNTTGSAEQLENKIESLDGSIQNLRDKYEILKDDSRLLESTTEAIRSQFREMGEDADRVGGTVEDLIHTLQDLRAEVAKEYAIKIGVAKDDLDTLISATDLERRQELNTAREGLFAGDNPRIALGMRLVSDNLRRQAPAALSPDLSLNEASVVASELRKQQLAVQTQLAEGKFGFFSDEKKQLELDAEFLEKLIAGVQKNIETLDRLQGLRAQRERVERDNVAAQEALNPSVAALRSGAREFAARSERTIKSVPPGANAVDNYNSLAQAYEQIDKEAAEQMASLRTLQAAGLLTSTELGEEIAQTIQNGAAAARVVVDSAAEAAGDVKKSLESGGIEDARRRIEDAKKALEDGRTFSDAAGGVTEFNEAVDAFVKAKTEAILRSDDDPLIKDRALKELQREADAFKQGGHSEFTKKIRDFVKTGVERITNRFKLLRDLTDKELDNELSALNTDLQGADSIADAETAYQGVVAGIDAKFARRAARERLSAAGDAGVNAALTTVREQEKAAALLAAAKSLENVVDRLQQDTTRAQEQVTLLREQARIQQLIKIHGEDSKEVAEARLASERRIFENAVDQMNITQELKDELLDAWEYERKMASVNLAGPIADAVNAAGALVGILGKAYGRLVDMARQGALTRIRLNTVGQPVERARKTAEFEFGNEVGYNPDGSGVKNTMLGVLTKIVGGVAATNAKYEEELSAAEEDYKTSTGGGGGKKKKRIDEVLQKLSNQLEVAKINVDSGFSNDFAGIDATIAAANAELERRARAINSLSQNTERTKEEEKELTELLKEHANLAEFIKQKEEEIFRLKDQQGVGYVNVTQTVKDWAKENLNLASTLRDGIGSVLGDLTAGFANLFTDLANGTKSAANAFKDFALSVVKSLQQVIAKMIAIKIMQGIIGLIDPSGGLGLQKLANVSLGIPGNMTGGLIRKAGGGLVAGNLARDSKPHLLMPNEYVLRASATQAVGVDTLNQINAMGNRKAIGGLSGIGKSQGASMGSTNVWVVSPEQKPVPGPNDIIAIISDDMVRGGTTKRLVKSIQHGDI